MPNTIDIDKLRRGDRKTFQGLFVYFYPKLMALACRFVNEYIAKDLVQEVFANLWESKHTLEVDNLYSYLFKCLQNNCLNYLKHQMVVDEYEARVRIAEARLAFWSEHSDVNDVMKYVMDQNLREIIEASANKLPPKCREAFFLCYFHDLSHKEVAEAMHISPRTVETHIRQAILFLRADLKDLFILLLAFSIRH